MIPACQGVAPVEKAVENPVDNMGGIDSLAGMPYYSTYIAQVIHRVFPNSFKTIRVGFPQAQ